ncbi:NUDIX domain-containing protein [Lactobacillus xujianguonis]|uniref:Bis(5'-nucleosyl)-tetraphosphatase [asymmetrical] n=1 Tax=Lactobacillus xujianguonis TaxID=2495899 RepID=A0A437SXM1_9LACO|nr:NUDIX domain-containing protein [Lactobacillus xujianguonis]RVU71620.1 NUDIX domain-containing protein [Lactobacillus xujianguonis]RVU77729.1 NUDIX domain-containing protein [Lactobacillus xujianguonis]
MIHEHSAGSIIYRKNNGQLEFLIVKSVLHHSWGFPKGHLEPGETEKEAAQREVAEEVGLHPKFDFNFQRQTEYHTEEGTIKKVDFFLSEYNPDQAVVDQKEEILNSKWITASEGPAYFVKGRGLEQMLLDATEYLKKQA